jgi:glycerol-3-phosphate O-acyltransferase
VDRRKKNPIYLETLKTMSNLSIQRGVNSLFFPGGTRSRSGALEADLKMGLLGTTIEAQRALCQRNSDRKVFIVPLVINYHFVLEAPFLIEEHLRRTGKEQYIRLRDESTSIRSTLRFIWRFFSTSSDITLSIGKPIDVLGNFVDARGRSFDRYGHEIQIGSYFQFAGKVNVDAQREAEYTKLLADRILERYRAENVVLCSHLIAFTVFQLLLHQHPKLDIYGILRLPPDDYVFPIEVVEEIIRQFRELLIKWEQEHRLKLSPEIHHTPAEIIKEGVKKLGAYHREEPLSLNKDGDIVSSDFKVLYYYHNRLDCYGLEKKIQWKTEGILLLNVE